MSSYPTFAYLKPVKSICSLYYFDLSASLTLYCPYLYSYPIGIPLFETRLMSPLGH